VTDRLIRITTALAVMAVAAVASFISYQHAFELVRSPGSSPVPGPFRRRVRGSGGPPPLLPAAYQAGGAHQPDDPPLPEPGTVRCKVKRILDRAA